MRILKNTTPPSLYQPFSLRKKTVKGIEEKKKLLKKREKGTI
jgi:hypothetical protein